MTRSTHQSTKRAAGRQGEKTAQGKTPAKLLVAMTGKASAAKTATGDEPVFAYIASLPQPQRGIAEGIDALAAKCLPDIQRAVKWGMAYYGVDGGWCFCLRRLRWPCETDVHPRHGDQAGTACDADRDGQIHPRSRVSIG